MLTTQEEGRRDVLLCHHCVDGDLERLHGKKNHVLELWNYLPGPIHFQELFQQHLYETVERDSSVIG
jgi:hypothetical protein